MDSKALFAKTPPGRLFFIAALPGAVSMLASALYQLMDGIFVGRFLGETPFAALNLAMPFVIINFALADLIGVGSSVPISVSLGKRREKEANNIFTSACIMIFAAGIIMGAALYFAAPFLMRAMGASGDFADFAADYLRVYAICSPFTTIVFAADNFLRICGRIKYSMFLNIFMSLISTGLEFLFLGVLKWDIKGAAAATCTGMFLSAAAAFVPFFKGSLQLKFTRPRFSAAMIRRIIACGSPNFLNNIAGRITSVIMNFILVGMGGETAVSVYGILMYVEGFIQPLLYGMCDSLQPAVGFNWGAGCYSRVRAIEKRCFAASAAVSLCGMLAICLLPQEIATLFMGNGGKAVFDMAVGALPLFGLTYITRWFSFATQSYMLAVEKPLPASLISICTALVFPVAMILALRPLGLDGIWLNFASTALLAAVMAGVILMVLRKQLNRTDSPLRAREEEL